MITIDMESASKEEVQTSLEFLNISSTLDIAQILARAVSYKTPSSASPDQAPVPGCRHSSCVLIIHVCLCVRASVCACEFV